MFHKSEKAEKDYWNWYHDEEDKDIDQEVEDDEGPTRVEKPKTQFKVPDRVQQETNDFMNTVENCVEQRTNIYI